MVLPTERFRANAAARATVDRLRARSDLTGTRALVVGAGQSGRSAARLLERRGAEVWLADDRREVSGVSPAQLVPIERARVEAADLVVLSPGVPRARPELAGVIERGLLIGEVELASWFIQAPLVGITGTNGKSTTTALVGHILSEAGLRTFVGGNLGRPATEMAEGAWEVGVLELSSYQLESLVSAQFRVGTWLNLTPDHLDRYADLHAYAAAKARLIEQVEPGGVAVLNAEDPLLREWGSGRAGVRWFSADDAPEASAAPALPGRHNRSNIAAALASVAGFSLPGDRVRAALSSFPGLPHRLERVRELDGVTYFNDSKATNVDSAVTAVRALSPPKILIAGGKDKGASWQPLVEAARGSVRVVLAIGQAAPLVAAAFQDVAPVFEHARTLEAAVRRAQALARPGEVVLLSPACASFDQFQNFEHRGEEFKRLVARLEPRRTDHG